jgi:hypothetical protein
MIPERRAELLAALTRLESAQWFPKATPRQIEDMDLVCSALREILLREPEIEEPSIRTQVGTMILPEGDCDD